MIQFEKLRPEHLLYITPHRLARERYEELLSPVFAQIITASLGESAWYKNKCIAAAGVVRHWKGRGEVWFIAGRDAEPHTRAIVKRMRQMLERIDLHRIEFVVHDGDPKGEKLAKMLGFTDPRLMRKYSPTGEDCTMYVRVS